MKNFLVFILVITPISTFAGIINFLDVPDNHRFYNEIQFVKDEGIVNGYEDGTYQPESEINRAEFTKIIIESIYSDEEIDNCDISQNTFSDIQSSDWFAKYVCLARKEGVINGYDEGYFKPEQTITLPEAMKIILEANEIDLEIYTISNCSNESSPYCEGENQWYSKYMNFFIAHYGNQRDLFSFIPEGDVILLPGQQWFLYHNVSRGEMAYFISEIRQESSNVQETKTYENNFFMFKYYPQFIGYNEEIKIVRIEEEESKILISVDNQTRPSILFITGIENEDQAALYIKNYFIENLGTSFEEERKRIESIECRLENYKVCDIDYLHRTVFEYSREHQVLVYWRNTDILMEDETNLPYQSFTFNNN